MKDCGRPIEDFPPVHGHHFIFATPANVLIAFVEGNPNRCESVTAVGHTPNVVLIPHLILCELERRRASAHAGSPAL